MTIKRFNEYEILNEGKFDSIIGRVTSDIYNVIKSSKKKKIHVENEYDTPFNFILDLIIDRDTDKYVKDKLDYQIFNAWSDEEDGKSLLSITIDIDPEKEPQIYSRLLGEIKGTLRHELEHLTQFGPNRIEGRPFNKPKEQKKFDKDVDEGKLKNIMLNKTEIPAYVYGLYQRAKTEKKPIDVVFNDRLNYFVRMGRLTKKQKAKILKKWMKFAKENLQRARYKKRSI